MIDFQYIRNKQKWLFGLIAIPVIIGFVVLFTPDAEDRIFGRGRQSETGVYGQLNEKTVTREQWIEARNIVVAQLGPQSRGIPESFLNNRAVQVLGEKALMERYGINPSQSDSNDWILSQIDKSIEGLPSESRPTRGEAYSNWAQGLGASSAQVIRSERQAIQQEVVKPSPNLSATKQKVWSAIGNTGYDDVKNKFANPGLFEGTQPVPEGDGRGPFSGVNPNDPGVDLNNIPGMGQWAAVAAGKRR